jgi:RimJ/RimL family protein N-acetyltransferase
MFGERRYHKCEVAIHAYNEASLALHDKLGFQAEGRLRDHEFFAGRYHDVVLMGLTVGEFAERYPFPDVTVR